MKRIVILGIVALAACKTAEGKPQPPDPPVQPTVTMESVRAEACACADEDCADRVMAEMEIQRRNFEEAWAEATVCVQKHKPVTPGDDVIEAMRGFQLKICACKDKTCAEFVDKEMMEWAMKNMDQLKGLKPTEAQEEEANKIQVEMERCRERLE